MAFKEIGFSKAARYAFFSMAIVLFRLMFVSPLRVLFISAFGAKVGRNVVIEDIKFANLYRAGLHGLSIGDNCYLGPESLLDLAGPIKLENNVTISCRAILLTHVNVGFQDHPLQKHLPADSWPLVVCENSFVGAGAIISGARRIGPNTAIGAGSVVPKDTKGNEIVAGVPAKTLRRLSF